MVVQKSQNFVFGAGNLYVAKRKSDGTYEGQRYIGETPGFGLSVAVNRVEMTGRDCGTVNQVIDSVVTSTQWSASFQFRNMSFENYQMAFQGTKTSPSQVATPVTAVDVPKVEQGLWYQLGRNATNPIGIGEISAFSITTPTGAVAGTDYEVDLKRGRVYIIPGSTKITDGLDLKVSYTPVVQTRTLIASGGGTDDYEIYYESCNPRGKNNRLLIPRASIVLSGDLSFKGDNFLEGSFDAQIIKRGDLALVYIDGEAQ